MSQADELKIGQAAKASLIRHTNVESCLAPRGHFKVQHWRAGKLIGEYEFLNGITIEGKNKLLDVMFHGTTAIATWYLGMISLTSYTALAAADTYDNIGQSGNGWAEFTSYTDAANSSRRDHTACMGGGCSFGQAITNASPVVFRHHGLRYSQGTCSLWAVMPRRQTKGDHASGSVLWATALFTSGDVAVNDEDQLKVTYSVSA